MVPKKKPEPDKSRGEAWGELKVSLNLRIGLWICVSTGLLIWALIKVVAMLAAAGAQLP